MYHATHRLSKERLKSVSRLRAACPLSDGMAPVCLGLVERVVDGRRRLEFGDQESSRELDIVRQDYGEMCREWGV